jgi:hypothetical protein
MAEGVGLALLLKWHRRKLREKLTQRRKVAKENFESLRFGVRFGEKSYVFNEKMASLSQPLIMNTEAATLCTHPQSKEGDRYDENTNQNCHS